MLSISPSKLRLWSQKPKNSLTHNWPYSMMIQHTVIWKNAYGALEDCWGLPAISHNSRSEAVFLFHLIAAFLTSSPPGWLIGCCHPSFECCRWWHLSWWRHTTPHITSEYYFYSEAFQRRALASSASPEEASAFQRCIASANQIPQAEWFFCDPASWCGYGN